MHIYCIRVRLLCHLFNGAIALWARNSALMAALSSSMKEHCVTTSSTIVVPLFVQPMYPSLSRRIGNTVPPENDIAVYAIGTSAWYQVAVDSFVSRASKDSLTVVSNTGDEL